MNQVRITYHKIHTLSLHALKKSKITPRIMMITNENGKCTSQAKPFVAFQSDIDSYSFGQHSTDH